LPSSTSAAPTFRREAQFDDNVYWCTRSADPEAFAPVEEVFKRYGIMEAATAYLGRPVGVKHVNAQINDQDLAFWKRVFPDTQLADPWGSYLHIDGTYGILMRDHVHDRRDGAVLLHPR
jgi:hypothetical protein